MGYKRHHAILVTTWDKEKATLAHQKAQEIFGDLVSELSKPVTNSFRSFVVFPDGSNEGWETSDKGDENRANFKTWLDQQAYEDGSTSYDWIWFEIQYGDDDDENKVIADSGEARRRRHRVKRTIEDTLNGVSNDIASKIIDGGQN